MIKPFTFQKNGVAASKHDLAIFKAEFELRLPTCFHEFCLKYNGGFPSNDNCYYQVPKIYKGFHAEYCVKIKKPVGTIIEGLFRLTTEIGACDPRAEIRSLREISSIRTIPIGFDLFGNSALLREDDPDGAVYWRDHELWEAPGTPYLMPIAPNLETFYNFLTHDSSITETES